MRFPTGWNFERIGLTIFALGAAIITFTTYMRAPAKVLPLEARRQIVAADREFLEAAPPPAPFIEINTGRNDGPRMADVIGDRCTGKDCQVTSITTAPAALANLPSCNASSRAMARFVTDGSSDGGGSDLQCDGSNWISFGGSSSGGGGGVSTASAPLVVTGSNIAMPAASASQSGYLPLVGGLLVVDAGLVVMGGGGIEVRNSGSGTTLLRNQNTNFTGIVQSDTGTTLTLYAGAFPTFKVGAAAAGNAGVSTPYAYRSTGASGDVVFGQLSGSKHCLGTSDVGCLSYNGTNVVSSVGVQATTYLRTVGVATGSLPTCDANAKGAIETDTTLSCLKFCNGSAWSTCFGGGSSWGNWSWSATCFGGGCAPSANFIGPMRGVAGSVAELACSWGTAGTDATGIVHIEVWNETDSVPVCTYAVAACNAAAGLSMGGGCVGALSASKTYTVRIDSSSDCLTYPQNIVCNVRMTP